MDPQCGRIAARRERGEIGIFFECLFSQKFVVELGDRGIAPLRTIIISMPRPPYHLSPPPQPPLVPRPPPRDRSMAASSPTSPSRSPTTKRNDRFRPQFPVDPFGYSVPAPKPSTSTSISSSLSDLWLLKPDQMPFSIAYRRDVVLVLGGASETHCRILTFAHYPLPPQLHRRDPLQHC